MSRNKIKADLIYMDKLSFFVGGFFDIFYPRQLQKFKSVKKQKMVDKIRSIYKVKLEFFYWYIFFYIILQQALQV